MNCTRPELNELLPAFIEEDLSPEQEEVIITHSAECQKCYEDLSLIVDLNAALFKNKEKLRERFKGDTGYGR